MLALLLSTSLLFTAPADWRTPFEKGNGNTTATHAECIDYYKRSPRLTPKCTLREAGTTDIGQPLHEVVLSLDGDADPAGAGQKPARALHPKRHPSRRARRHRRQHDAGPRLRAEERAAPLLENVTLVIIPIYNVDGCPEPQLHHPRQPERPRGLRLPGQRPQPRFEPRLHQAGLAQRPQLRALCFRSWQPEVFRGNPHLQRRRLPVHHDAHCHPAQTSCTRLWGSTCKQQLLPALYTGMEKKKWPHDALRRLRGPERRRAACGLSGNAPLLHRLRGIVQHHGFHDRNAHAQGLCAPRARHV